ncbi:MAG: energy transducer TonB [Alphaproteobacteria bacterium]
MGAGKRAARAAARGTGARVVAALIGSLAVHGALAAAWVAFRDVAPVPLATIAVELIVEAPVIGDAEPPGRPDSDSAVAAESPRAPVETPRPATVTTEAPPPSLRPAQPPSLRPTQPGPRAKPSPVAVLATLAAAKLSAPPRPASKQPANRAKIRPAAVRAVSPVDPVAAEAPTPMDDATAPKPAEAGPRSRSAPDSVAALGAGGTGATQPGFSAGSASNPLPRYPLTARRRGQEGRVLLRVRVDAAGRPTTVEVRRGSGHAILDGAAARAVRGWRFEPAMRAGQPVAGTVEVPILFRLTG